MLDLRNMSDEEFSIVVRSSAPQSTLQVTFNENGYVQFNSKLAEKFARKIVQLGFNPVFTALQVACTEEPIDDSKYIFPKNGRKKIPEVADYFKKAHIPFPVVFCGILLENGEKWRGERQVNPTEKPLQTSRSIKKK